jgi:5S rRNA maturation endonuclease (ribonuclease M5)
MTPFELVLERLSRVKGSGRQRTARCPAHHDRENSLSVNDSGDVLLCCHAGCQTEEVVAALGLEMKDLFLPRDEGVARNISRPSSFLHLEDALEVYDYVDEEGRLQGKVGRFVPKAFRPFHRENGSWKLGKGDVRWLPYRLPSVIKRCRRAEWVIVVEGEKDVHTLERLGFVATTNAGGAEAWKPEYGNYFAGGSVAILPDHDKAGNGHRDAVARSVHGKVKVTKVLELPGLPAKGKDVTDWVNAGGTAEELRALIEEAPEWSPGEARAGGAGVSELTNQLELEGLACGPLGNGAIVRAASSISPEPVEYAWEGRWPLKSLSLIVGVWGVNKSMCSLEAAARLSRGQLPGDLRGQPRSVIVASAEDAPSHTQVPRLIAAGADRDKVFFISMARDDFESDISLPDDIEAIERAIVEHDAALVIVDPLTAHLGAEVNSHKDQDVRRALGPLARVADRTGCAIVAVVHLNKVISSDLFMKIGGSVGIGAAARSILLVATDPEGEDQGPDRVVVHGKSNVGPYAPTLRFKVERRLIAGSQGKKIETAGITWTGEAPGIGPRSVLGGSPEERQARMRDAAEELLKDMLAEGPRLRTDIEEAAAAAGVSWRTVERAKGTLEIVSEQRQERGKIGRGPAYWNLPKRSTIFGPTTNTNKMADQISAGQRMVLGFGPPSPPRLGNNVADQTSASDSVDDHLRGFAAQTTADSHPWCGRC